MDKETDNTSEYAQIYSSNLSDQESEFISEDIIPSFQLSNIFYHGEDAEGFDLTSGDKWIYPTNFPIREYQFNIVKCALFKNTLVCLPTGLGKTFIAAVVMYNYYRWYPKGKIIFLAPTRPLTNQQIEACQKIMGISKDHMEEFTGKMKPELRKEKWIKNRIFFATPQVIANDIKNNFCNIRDIKCIVFDEAHKAQGNFAYCEVIKSVVKFNTKFRVLALSATPGSTLVAVQQVLANLLISQLIVKDENSEDVKPYIHERHVTTVVVPLSNDIKNIRERFVKILEKYFYSLQQYKVLRGAASSFSKYKLLTMQEEFTRSRAKLLHPAMASQIQGDFSACITLYSALDLLIKHGVHSFVVKLEELITFGSSNFKIRLSRDQMLCDLVKDLKDELCSREFQVQDPNVSLSKVETSQLLRESLLKTHPKMEKLEQIVVEHFNEFEKNNKSTRVIVFVENRSATSQICNVLQYHYPLVKAMIFIGQLKEGSLGYTQKKQIEVMKKFRDGVYNTLISTCVGEEGLDIGEVDLIVCYDTSASIVRLKQRFGRTGRQRLGRVIMLVTEGAEAEKLKRCMYRTNTMSSTLFNMQLLQPYFYKESPKMVPQGFEPQCLKMNLAVEPEPGHNQDMRKFFKPKKKNTFEPKPNNIFCDLDLLSYNRLPETSYMSNLSVEALQTIFMETKDQNDLSEDKSSNMGSNHILEQKHLNETCLVEHSSDTKDLVSLMQRAEAKRSKQFPATQAAALASQVAASDICSKKGKGNCGKWVRKRKITAPKCKMCGNCNYSNCKEISSRKKYAHDKCFQKSKPVNAFSRLDNVETIKEPNFIFPEYSKTVQKETETDTLFDDVLERALEQYNKVQNKLLEKNKSSLKPVKLNLPPTLVEVLKKNKQPKEKKIDLSFECNLIPEQLQHISKESLKQYWNNINNIQSTGNINAHVRKHEQHIDNFPTKGDLVKLDNDKLHINEMPNFNLNVFLSTDDVDKFVYKKTCVEIEPESYYKPDSKLEETKIKKTLPVYEISDRCVEVFQTANNITFDLSLNDFFNDTFVQTKPVPPFVENESISNNEEVIHPAAYSDYVKTNSPFSPVCEEHITEIAESATSFELDYPESPVLGTQQCSIKEIQNEYVSAASSTPKGHKDNNVLSKTVQETLKDFNDADTYEVFSQSLLAESFKLNSAIKESSICGGNRSQSSSLMTYAHAKDKISEHSNSIAEYPLEKDTQNNLICNIYNSSLSNIINKSNEEEIVTRLENRKKDINKEFSKNEREKNEENVSLTVSNEENRSLFRMNDDYDELFENLCTSLLEQKYEVLVKDTKIDVCKKNNTSDKSISSVETDNCNLSENEIKEKSFDSDSDIFSEFLNGFDKVNTTETNETMETETTKEVYRRHVQSVETSHENINETHFIKSPNNRTSTSKHTELNQPAKQFHSAANPIPIVSPLSSEEKVDIQSVPKLQQITKKPYLFDDDDDDFLPVASRKHDQRTKFSLSDYSLSETKNVSHDITDQHNEDPKRKENKKKRNHRFIDDEADVSVDCAISSDEDSEGLDEYDKSFVNDDEDDDLVNRHTQLQEKFVHSMIKEFNAPVQFKKHNQSLDIYSQVDNDPHDSYEEDSFCVKSSDDSASTVMSELDIAEEIIKSKRNRSPNEIERPLKRRRIIVPSGDSDDSDICTEEISQKLPPQNNLAVDILQLRDTANIINVETSNMNMVSDNMPVNSLKKQKGSLTWSDDDFENCHTRKLDKVTVAKKNTYLNHKSNNLSFEGGSNKENYFSAVHKTNFSSPEIVVLISYMGINSAGILTKKLKQQYKATVHFADLGEVDFVVSHRIGIVRLQIKGSVIQENILSHKKVCILRSLFSHPVIIIERLCDDNLDDTKDKLFEVPFHLARVMALDTSLRILFSTNEDDTFKIIHSLACAEAKQGYGTINAANMMDIHAKTRDFFIQLPGVNFALALYLHWKYKSVAKFCERCKSMKDIERELTVDVDMAHHLHNILNKVVQP